MPAFTHSATIRWSDINALNIVSDAAIATYIEESRAALVRHIASATGGVDKADGQLIYLTARQRIDYLRPVRWQEEPLFMHLHILSIRPAAAELQVRVGDADRPSAVAHVVSVCWDVPRNRPRCLTGDQRRLLETYLQPAPAATPP